MQTQRDMLTQRYPAADTQEYVPAREFATDYMLNETGRWAQPKVRVRAPLDRRNRADA